MALSPGKLHTSFVLILLLFLTACSSTTFVYNRLDYLLPWYVEDYVELDRGQEDFLDELLEPFLERHRREELPRYLEILTQIETAIDRPLNDEDVELLWKNFEEAWLRLERESLDWLLVLGERLSQEQMQEFVENLRDKQGEFEEKYLKRDEQEFAEDNYDNLLDSMQDYMGRLNKEQRTMARAAVQEMKRSDKVWLQERARWFDQLEQILQREPGWEQEIRTAVDNREENLLPEYVEVFEHNTHVLSVVVVQIINSRTDKQDRHLRERLAELKQDLATLIAQAEPEE